jgi:hypothetical protein
MVEVKATMSQRVYLKLKMYYIDHPEATRVQPTVPGLSKPPLDA